MACVSSSTIEAISSLSSSSRIRLNVFSMYSGQIAVPFQPVPFFHTTIQPMPSSATGFSCRATSLSLAIFSLQNILYRINIYLLKIIVNTKLL